MGTGASSGRNKNLSGGSKRSKPSWTSRFLASTSAPMLCPERTTDKESSYAGPDSGKSEDRKCIVKKAAIAELKVKEADTKLRKLEKQIRELTVINTELKQEVFWAKMIPTNSSGLDCSFTSQSTIETTSNVKENEEHIAELKNTIKKLQDALDHTTASEAIKDVKIVELQQNMDLYSRRITDLEEIFRNRMDDDSLVSVSPTFEQIIVDSEPYKVENVKKLLELGPAIRSNMRTVSAQNRKLSPTRMTNRPSSVQVDQRKRNERPKNLSQKISEKLGRNSEDLETDIQDLLNTKIIPSTYHPSQLEQEERKTTKTHLYE